VTIDRVTVSRPSSLEPTSFVGDQRARRERIPAGHDDFFVPFETFRYLGTIRELSAFPSLSIASDRAKFVLRRRGRQGEANPVTVGR